MHTTHQPPMVTIEYSQELKVNINKYCEDYAAGKSDKDEKIKARAQLAFELKQKIDKGEPIDENIFTTQPTVLQLAFTKLDISSRFKYSILKGGHKSLKELLAQAQSESNEKKRQKKISADVSPLMQAAQKAQNDILGLLDHKGHQPKSVAAPSTKGLLRRLVTSPSQNPPTTAETASANPIESPREFWQKLDHTTKTTIVKRIFSSRSPEECNLTVKIGHNEHVIDWRHRGRGTAGDVYIIRVDNIEFALKILRAGKLEPSITNLLNHSIEGLVPMWAADQVTIDDRSISLVAMDVMSTDFGARITKLAESKDTFQDKLSFALTCICRLSDALIKLKSKGFVHGNIGQSNVMFDENDRVAFVDIDNIPSTTDKYADHRMSQDARAVNSLLGDFLFQIQCKDPIYKTFEKFFWESNGISKIEDYLANIIELIRKFPEIHSCLFSSLPHTNTEPVELRSGMTLK